MLCPEDKGAFKVMEIALCVLWLLVIVALSKMTRQIGAELKGGGGWCRGKLEGHES